MTTAHATRTLDTLDCVEEALAANAPHLAVSDHRGRRWVVLEIDGQLRARPQSLLPTETCTEVGVVTTAAALLSECGPLTAEMRI